MEIYYVGYKCSVGVGIASERVSIFSLGKRNLGQFFCRDSSVVVQEKGRGRCAFYLFFRWKES